MERLKKAVHKVMDDQKELGKRFREVVEQAVARVDKRVVCIMVICSHGGGFTPRKTIPDVIGPEHTESVTYISPVPLGVCNVSLKGGRLCEDLKNVLPMQFVPQKAMTSLQIVFLLLQESI
jgi:hypothetical protein